MSNFINGTVAPGFESVRQLYEHNMGTMAEENTQLCIYHRGEKVVDLWASATPDSHFTADSLVNVFSSGKSLEAIAMASLVGKGLLRYDAKIADYWPEFAANGKSEITVADLMRHEAGLANFSSALPLDDLLTENIKQNKVGRFIEEHAQKFGSGDGAKREYHAVTRGWIANEVFRRLDPAGRSCGESPPPHPRRGSAAPPPPVPRHAPRGCPGSSAVTRRRERCRRMEASPCRASWASRREWA